MTMNNKEAFDRSFDSLEMLVDSISEHLQCAVTIEDAHHRLIAYSSHGPQTDPVRIATIIGRRVPEKVIQALWQEGVIPQLLESDEPLSVSAISDIGLGKRWAIAIRQNNDILGYIWLIEAEHPLDEAGRVQLKKAAQAARTKLVQLQINNHREENGLQDYFWQLLTGYMRNDAAIKEKAEKLGIMLPSSFQIIVFQFASDITQKLHQQIRYLLTTLPGIPFTAHVVHNDQFILLAAPPKLKIASHYADIRSRLIKQLKTYFGAVSFTMGCGAVYRDYALVEKSYQEALSLLRLKDKLKKEAADIYTYPDLGYYRYLPLILGEIHNHPFENECLQSIKQYDLEHDSQLLQTLDTFLSNNSHIKETADALKIHTNTLNYRLKRIAEIGSLDLNNMHQVISLYLELKAVKLGL